MREIRCCCLGALAAACAGHALVAAAQPVAVQPGIQAAGQVSSADQTTRTVRGLVVNAVSGGGIARALVTLNQRRMLTDAEGKFEFQQFTGDSASVTAHRPGFSTSPSGGGFSPQQRATNLDEPVVVRLFPDVIVSGLVSGSDGLPLAGVQVTLRRLNNLGVGPRAGNAAFAMTNSRGEYRMRTPGGRVRVAVMYTPRLQETGEAVSPVSFPELSANSAEGYMRLAPGEERRVDLRPRTGPAYPVTVQVDAPESRNNLRFWAVPESGDGFYLGYTAAPAPGAYRLQMPNGSYTLHVRVDGRAEDALDGSARVTVAGRPVTGLVMRLAPETAIAIEVRLDAASGLPSPTAVSSGQTTADVQQLNLSLKTLGPGVSDGAEQNITPRQRPDRTSEFRVAPGRYRLQCAGSGWYVVAATLGVTDLLTGEMAIGPGAAGQTMRLVVSNVRGRLRGRVQTAAGGAAVYLVPRQPSLTPLQPVITDIDGNFETWLPVGSYAAVAFAEQADLDVQDPATVARLISDGAPVQVTADNAASVTLPVESVKESAR